MGPQKVRHVLTLSCIVFSEFHLCELIVLKNIKTQKAVQRQTRLFLISFSENRKKKKPICFRSKETAAVK